MRALVTAAASRAAAALFAVMTLSAPALADIAPPPGYVERCTVKNHQQEGRTCTACPSDFKRRGHCELELGPKGYTKMCSTRGASVWTEVWCLDALPTPAPEPKPAQPSEPTPEPAPAPTPKLEVKAADVAPKRDSKCGAGGLEFGLPLAFAFGAITLFARRRS